MDTQIIDNPGQRKVHIYVISCSYSNKQYVGQAVTHILNHKRYRPYGMIGRFKSHISEAFSNKKKQCCYLNNAIRKYGKDSFSVSLLACTTFENADKMEQYYIKHLNTLCPNGYNLTNGGNCTRLSLESRLKLSKTVSTSIQSRIDRFYKVLSKSTNPTIRELNRNGSQYGWYVYWDGIKADFGGKHISLEESLERANQLVRLLEEKRDSLLRETP
jgi:hypothetical protein